MSSLTASPGYSRVANELQEGTPRGARGDRPLPRGELVIGLASVILALATAEECHSITHVPSLIYGIVLWGWWGLVAGMLWRLAPILFSMHRISALNVALHLVVGCAIATAHLVLLGSLSLFIPEWKVNAPALVVLTGLLNLNRFGLEILIYGFIFGLIGVIQFRARAQRDAVRSLELQRQLSAAHLKALQMQLEPHFLFNTLNAITTLVELGRQAQAAEMLGHLNAILKRTLERNVPEKIPLSQELEILESYLAIEQVRFADRLHVDIKVQHGALHCLVPCFLLQPIVENAIRHGIAHCEDAGVVESFGPAGGKRAAHCSARQRRGWKRAGDAGQRNRADQHAGAAGVFLSGRICDGGGAAEGRRI